MKTPTLLLIVLVVTLSCKSSQSVESGKATVSTNGLPPGEVELQIPCSGPEFYTDEHVFRANSVAVSNYLEVSKRMAMTNARAELAAAIEVTVGTVTDNYVKSLGGPRSEVLSQRFESLNREVVSQRLTGLRTLCERYFLTEEGRYKTYVAIELSAQQLAENYKKRIELDSALANDFDYEKFKATFDAEMAKHRGN